LIFRTYNFGISQTNNFDFGLRHLSSAINPYFYLEFLNKWATQNSFNYIMPTIDPRLLRGGPAMLVPANWSYFIYVRTDPSKKIFLDGSFNVSVSDNNRSSYYSYQSDIVVMPINKIKLTASMNYTKNHDALQYVTETTAFDNSSRYLLGSINQHTLSLTFRMDYNITNEISIQYYGSPFASIGTYSAFKEITNPLATIYHDRFTLLNPTINGTNYQVYFPELSNT